MPLVASLVRAVLATWSVAATIVSSSSASASPGGATQGAERPARPSPWACRLIPVPSLRVVVEKGMERSETIRRQCQELAAARAVVVLEWGAMADSQLHARTAIEVRRAPHLERRDRMPRCSEQAPDFRKERAV